MRGQAGFFDLDERLKELSAKGFSRPSRTFQTRAFCEYDRVASGPLFKRRARGYFHCYA